MNIDSEMRARRLARIRIRAEVARRRLERLRLEQPTRQHAANQPARSGGRAGRRQ